MKNWIKYGLANAILGLFIGLYISLTAIGKGYFVFTLVIPLAMFLVGGLLWKWIVRDKYHESVVITGILTGTLSHIITFVLIAGISIIYQWITGSNITRDLFEGITNVLSFILFASLSSLMFFGIFTIPYAIIVGVIIARVTDNKVSKSLPRDQKQ